MKYHIFIDSNNRTRDDGGNYVGTPSNFYYNIQGFLPILEYSTYIMHVEYVHIFNTEDADEGNGQKTYFVYNSNTYNVMANLGNQSNILSNDSYINIFSGSTDNYTRLAYYAAVAVEHEYVLTNSCLEGKEGPKLVVSNPKELINIQILNGDGAPLRTYANVDVPRVRMLLVFKPFI